MKALPFCVSALVCLASVGCAGTKIITIKQTNLDGSSEYWVCEGGTAKTCGGEREQQIDPPGYQDRAEIHSPPKGCVHGVATLDVVLEGSDVKRVRYECAQPPLPPPTPSGLPAAPPGPGTGLPGGVP